LHRISAIHLNHMENHFLQTIKHLRDYEEVMLYGNLLQVSEEHQQETVDYLSNEYKREALNYPGKAPLFDSYAALWSARTIYIGSQLLLYRENKEADIEMLLPAFEKEISASTMLSADLLLRFLPDLVTHLKVLDPSDKLVAILEIHLRTWHYSGVAYPLPVEELDFTFITSDQCLQQLYVDRVIENKRISFVTQSPLGEAVKASLGNFAGILWTDLKHQGIEEK
jgi:MoxR-vWA-beta-propeller ternary system domain bpX4